MVASTSSPVLSSAEKDLRMMDESDKVSNEQKFILPGFTVKELLGAIPSECFERSALHSSIFIVQDVIALACMATLATYIPKAVELSTLTGPSATLLKYALWSTFWFWSSLPATGLWVIAHECGHQAFSSSKTINNAVGWVLHSALGVPYHSWRISHGRHHAATGHLTRDEVFVPRTRGQLGIPKMDEAREDVTGMNVTEERQEELREAIGDAPIVVLAHLLAQQLFGWPLYLIRNASGQKHYPRFTNHFQPSSFIFEKRHLMQIIASDIGIALLFTALGTWTYYRSFSEVVHYYLVPYLLVNHWLVSITFLQHTDPLLPHYSAAEWTFPRGALATIDRSCLGWVGPVFLHGICEWHVVHHVSSKIPHWNGKKATAALKEFLGPHYQYRDDNFFVALYSSFRDCRFIEDGVDVAFFKNAKGVAKMVAADDDGKVVSDSGVDLGETSSN